MPRCRGISAADDALSVCFDGAVLAQPLDLLGAAALRLRVTSDRPLAFLVARLCDVAPDGASVRIAHGMLNLCHRASREHPEPMVPGRAEEVEIVLDQMAYRLAPGHHLRLALSTTYWPFVWPSPQAATVTVLEGALDLPVHEGAGEEWVPPPPEGAAPWKHRVLRKARAERRVETDLIGGAVTLIVADDLGEVENLTHGLTVAEGDERALVGASGRPVVGGGGDPMGSAAFAGRLVGADRGGDADDLHRDGTSDAGVAAGVGGRRAGLRTGLG